MFTGIITDLGTVRAIRPGDSTRLEIACGYDLESVVIGASIACAGICLTVVEKGCDSFSVDASNETLARTTLGTWTVGRQVNLERPLRAGDELGGHIVSGHVDAVTRVAFRRPDGDSVRFGFALASAIAPYIAPKGSVAVDGVSLTVNEVESDHFGVNLIPHTLAATSLGGLQAGDAVNLEIDVVARYVARLVRPELSSAA